MFNKLYVTAKDKVNFCEVMGCRTLISAPRYKFVGAFGNDVNKVCYSCGSKDAVEPPFHAQVLNVQ